PRRRCMCILMRKAAWKSRSLRGAAPSCSALPTTSLPNEGYGMDTWSTCHCKKPIHTPRPLIVSVLPDIDIEQSTECHKMMGLGRVDRVVTSAACPLYKPDWRVRGYIVLAMAV